MEDLSQFTDLSKYGYEARIFSADGKYVKIFTDKIFLEKVNQCEHLMALSNTTKDTILEVEKILSPLKPRAASLFIETKGGSVVAKMTLEDFFNLLDIGKRIVINDRFQKGSPLVKEKSNTIENEVKEFLNELGDE
jgi:hypothetical protein